MSTQKRTNSGVPAGGEFAAATHTEAAITLHHKVDNYIYVEGGLIQNDAGIDIIDLDILEDEDGSYDTIRAVFDARDIAAKHGLAGTVTECTNWLINIGALGADDHLPVNDNPANDYILMEGGLVQNNACNPAGISLDILDMDFLKDTEYDSGHAQDMLDIAVRHNDTVNADRIRNYLSQDTGDADTELNNDDAAAIEKHLS